MEKENKRILESGLNRCRRCDRPLSNPNDIYGWRCAEIVGLDNSQKAVDTLDDNTLKGYNNYVAVLSQALGAIHPYHVTVDFWTVR